MQALSTRLSPLQRKRAFKGYPTRLSYTQLTTPGGDQLLHTKRQANQVMKARASGKSIVLSFA